MPTLFLNVTGLLVAYALGRFMLGNTVLPLVYGLPRAMIWVVRGRCRPSAIFSWLLTALLSISAAAIALATIAWLMPFPPASMFASVGWSAGLFLAVAEFWYFVLFSRTMRVDIDERYLTMMERFLRPAPSQAMSPTSSSVRRNITA